MLLSSRSLFKGLAVTSAAVIVAVAGGSTALADDVSNTIDGSVDAVAEVMALNVGGANGATQLVITPANGDGKNGCNLLGNTTTLGVTISSSNPSVATVTPGSATFTSCGETKLLTVVPLTQGSTTVSVSQASNDTGSTFNFAPATFVVNVAPPANSAPSLTVTGVTAGGSYQKGSVPSAMCSVTDTEDGPSTFAATLSDVTGPLASYGLGNQTASCSYTDQGGLTESSSATYSIVDTAKPSLSLPADMTVEATGPSGAVVTFDASATDTVGPLHPAVTCIPTSGSTLALGTHTVTCSTEDAAGNPASGSFTVTVVDSTAPVLDLPDDQTIEATGPDGAALTFTATATDTVGPAHPEVTCAPASGSTFALGATEVSCSTSDAAGNPANGSFTVTVVDTTAPVLDLPDDQTIEATGPDGAALTFTTHATDTVGPAHPEVNCAPASGSTFPLGKTTVACSASDNAGNPANGSFSVSVVDTTPPVVVPPSATSAEATGPMGAVVTFGSASAFDLVSGEVPGTCVPASGSTFGLGETTVTCSATDEALNTGKATFTVTVKDTTAPTITWVGGPQNGASYVFGSVPAAGTCTAVDLVDGAVPCSVDGYATGVGTHTLTASAKDQAGNGATSTREYTVEAWTLKGFYSPVDMGGVMNIVKGGSTVPLKFEVFAGTEQTSTSVVKSFTTTKINCDATSLSDDVEFTTTGSTSLRYDSTAGQFVQNWQTPKSPGTCIKVTMATQDGSSLSANFKLK